MHWQKRIVNISGATRACNRPDSGALPASTPASLLWPASVVSRRASEGGPGYRHTPSESGCTGSSAGREGRIWLPPQPLHLALLPTAAGLGDGSGQGHGGRGPHAAIMLTGLRGHDDRAQGPCLDRRPAGPLPPRIPVSSLPRPPAGPRRRRQSREPVTRCKTRSPGPWPTAAAREMRQGATSAT